MQSNYQTGDTASMCVHLNPYATGTAHYHSSSSVNTNMVEKQKYLVITS